MQKSPYGSRPAGSGPVEGPPEPVEPRTWQSVAEARETAARRSRSGGKAQARRQRAKAAARARDVARQRRQALADLRWARAVARRPHAPSAAPGPPPRVVAPPAPVAPAPVAPASAPPVAEPERRRPAAAAVVRPGVVVPAVSARVRREPALVTLAAAMVLTLVALGVGLWLDLGADRADTAAATSADPAAEPVTAGADGSAASARDPGGYLRTRVRADGRLVSDHWLVSDRPVRELSVRPRPVQALAGTSPQVRRLEVTADGDPVPTRSGAVPAARSGLRIRFDDPVTTIHLRYVTRGGIVRNEPSTTGRALVVANPVALATDDVPVPGPGAGDDVVRLAGGGDVLNLACAMGRQLPVPCGRPDGVGWRVELPAGDRAAAVLAQVDLPAA